jgi:hypothetical protein
MQYTLGLEVINVILLLYLVYVYSVNLRTIKSNFTIGLLLFSVVFLIQNIVAIYFSITMMEYYVQGLEGVVFILTLLETLAFSVFVYITKS